MGRCSKGSTSHLRGHPGARSIRIIIKRWAANAGVESQRPLDRKPLEGSEGRVRLPWRPNRDNRLSGHRLSSTGISRPPPLPPGRERDARTGEDSRAAPLH